MYKASQPVLKSSPYSRLHRPGVPKLEKSQHEIRVRRGRVQGKLTYVFHAEELVSAIISDGACILQHLLQGRDLWFWFGIFILLVFS